MENISKKLRQHIRKKAHELDRLNHAVKISLPVDCHDHVDVAGIRDNQLIILTDSPVWQTRLRMYSQTILEALQQHSGIKLNRVILKLTPQKRVIKEAPPVYRNISKASSDIIAQTANCISDPDLQAALLHLTQKTKKP